MKNEASVLRRRCEMRNFFLIFLLLSLTNVKGEDIFFSITKDNSKSLKLIDKTGKIVFDKGLNYKPFDRLYYKKKNFIVENNEKWLIYNKNCELVKEYLISENTLYFSKNFDCLYLLINSKNIELHTNLSEFKSFDNKKDYYSAFFYKENIYLLYEVKDITFMDVLDIKEFIPKKSAIIINKPIKFYGKYLVSFGNESKFASVFDLDNFSTFNIENIKHIFYVEEFELFIVEYKDSPIIGLAQKNLEQIIETDLISFYPLRLYGGMVFQKKDGWYKFSNNKFEKIDDNPFCRFKSEFYKLLVNEQELTIDYYSKNKKIELKSSEYTWNDIILSDENIYLKKTGGSKYSDLLDKDGNFILKDIKILNLLSLNGEFEDRVYEIEFKKDTNWEMNKNKKYFYRNNKQISFIDIKSK